MYVLCIFSAFRFLWTDSLLSDLTLLRCLPTARGATLFLPPIKYVVWRSCFLPHMKEFRNTTARSICGIWFDTVSESLPVRLLPLSCHRPHFLCFLISFPNESECMNKNIVGNTPYSFWHPNPYETSLEMRFQHGRITSYHDNRRVLCTRCPSFPVKEHKTWYGFNLTMKTRGKIDLRCAVSFSGVLFRSPLECLRSTFSPVWKHSLFFAWSLSLLAKIPAGF